ncbi:hypothetical protein [Luteolibacter sp. Populi]|uniref:hypothetical protein n=1 Tax=Luteolibacter sp. Populi TaxID=3230487 RepID=UPI003466BE5E
MIATIQCITTEWTKFSRGAPHSAKRSAVPVAFSLPPGSLPAKACRAVLLHTIRALESVDFEPSQNAEMQDLTGILDYRCAPVALRFADDLLHVEYKGNLFTFGAPHRNQVGKDVFKLGPGSWGRIALNGRFGYAAEWTYYRKVFNIAFSEEVPPAGLFKGKPDAEFRDEHDLW